MKNLITRFLLDEQGQDIIEYALLGSFVSIAAYAGATQLATGYNAWFGDVATWVENAGNNLGGAPAAP
jgi:Flp pilus assembly pilin Flp